MGTRNERLLVLPVRRSAVESTRRRLTLPGAGRARTPQAATCTAIDCGLGPLPFSKTIVRFQHGFVKLGEEKDEFIVDRFEDGTRAKYAHTICAHSAGARPHELKPGWCVLCDHQFFREESAICVDAGVFIEHSRLLIPVFHPEVQGGCVHWACAWQEWSEKLFRGFL